MLLITHLSTIHSLFFLFHTTHTRLLPQSWNSHKHLKTSFTPLLCSILALTLPNTFASYASPFGYCHAISHLLVPAYFFSLFPFSLYFQFPFILILATAMKKKADPFNIPLTTFATTTSCLNLISTPTESISLLNSPLAHIHL